MAGCVEQCRQCAYIKESRGGTEDKLTRAAADWWALRTVQVKSLSVVWEVRGVGAACWDK